VIITTYRIEKISDDHPYIWRYTARRAPVIFDHPYNAESERLEFVAAPGRSRADHQVLSGGALRGRARGKMASHD
jgi:hypothetical protein